MNFKNTSRRSFIKTATIGSIASLSLTDIVSSAFAAEKVKRISLKKGNTILFQGDSITDGNRERNTKMFNETNADRKTSYNDFNSLGAHYVFAASSALLCGNPEKDLKILNRGISGNKVYQLAERWEQDCINIKPDVLSILIGVNDFWHTKAGTYNGTLEIYKRDYEALLIRTKRALPDVKLIIGEPFGITGINVVTNDWYPSFNEYRIAARELADKFNATFIPFQTVFDKALTMAPKSYWCFDGVHPSIPGAELMAKAWLNAVEI